ncbi:hypothetical protein WG66_002849 [Moniliophthora roreri]|nr:hypothetical protein WG66_002849 [Moniliophthora roreri]
MSYQSFRYKYELATLGMKDGPVTHARVPPLSRLQFLTAYRKDWSRLVWAHETRAQIPHGARAGASGGFLQQIRDHGGSATLDLMELPSGRTSRPPAATRHLRYITSAIESIAVDQVQALVVTSHAFSHQGQVGIQLHFRDLWSFNKHPHARALSYEFSTQVSSRLHRVDITICGSKVAVTHEFSGGRMKHLIINWYTLDARWLDDEDIQFLDETYLLGINRKTGIPVLCLYNISKASTIAILREFELPQTWDRSIIEFSPNNSPKSDYSLSPNALFYPAPETRILAIKARNPSSDARPDYTPRNWLFIKESYFRHPSRRDPFRISWKQWSQYCLVKEMVNYPPCIRGPYVMGTKAFFVENMQPRAHRSSHGTGSRLHVIDFSPFADRSDASTNWAIIGLKAGLVPSEYAKTIPPATVDGLAVEDMCVTEDNIVLITEPRHGYRLASILTFGAPPVSVRY